MNATTEDVPLPSGLRVRVTRAGGGPPLVYLHGAGGVADGDPVLAGLATSFEVTAPLAPGFADLDELDDLADVHDLAIHYAEVLDALGARDATVLGHSFGGMVAAELAAHYPDLVAKLVLVAPLGLWLDDAPVADLFAVPATELGGLLWADPDGPGARAMRAGSQSDADAAVEAVADRLVQVVQGMSAVAKFIWPIPDRGLRKRLRRITADTLVVWGARDRLVPVVYADEFARAIPRARVEVFDEAAHMVPVEAGSAFVDAVARFVK